MNVRLESFHVKDCQQVVGLKGRTQNRAEERSASIQRLSRFLLLSSSALWPDSLC